MALSYCVYVWDVVVKNPCVLKTARKSLMKFFDMYANTTPLPPLEQTCANPVWQTPQFADAPFADAPFANAPFADAPFADTSFADTSFANALDVQYPEPHVIHDESTFLPDPVQLSRQIVDDVPEPDPMLPSMWWLCTFLGLTALTALGIRHSRK